MDKPMHLYVDHKLPGCSGCRVCEKVCALEKERKYNPAYSRIKVFQFYPGPIDIPIVCQYCEDHPCIDACPTDALRYDEETFQMTVEEDLCNGCQLCNQACVEEGRGGCITFNPQKGIAQICDFCGGDPQCVKYCPSEVLHFFPPPRFPRRRLAKSPELIADRIAEQLYPVKKEVGMRSW